MADAATATATPLAVIAAQRLAAGKAVRRRLPGGGLLSIDRPLPVLYVYRRPADRPDPGTARLVAGEASYLLAAGGGGSGGEVESGGVLRAVLGALSDRFTAVLLVELWTRENPGADAPPADETAGTQRFRVVAPRTDVVRPTVAALVRGLRRVGFVGLSRRVEVEHAWPAAPGLAPLLEAAEAERLSVLPLGVGVPPVFREPGTGVLFPQALRQLHRELSRALQLTAFRFAHLQTTHRPEHYRGLGRGGLARAARHADAQLAEIADELDLLLAITPINTERAYAAFVAGGYRDEPTFHYRLLSTDPDMLKRRLYGVPLESVEDPALTELLQDQRDELDRQITLLHDRNTPGFLFESVQLHGEVEPELLATAEELLRTIPPSTPGARAGRACVDAQAFARRAREEIEGYRRKMPAFAATVEVRDDVPGVLVSRGKLLVGSNFGVSAARVEALLHHEVGTHLLTYFNARRQPLKLLASGLPGYEAVQEGTAVLAEHLAGGLTSGRLRLLAARVVAVQRLIARRTFREVFEELHEGRRFAAGAAFSITMRVFRGGGYTKDAVYLRGLVWLLRYLQRGGDVEPLFLGKVGQRSLRVIRELRWRHVLTAPPLQPRYLETPETQARLARLRAGVALTDLITPTEERA